MTASAAPIPEPEAALRTEIARRRTFAIISHPDAGKTTLTEKLLLFAGALREAGAVRARRAARATVSDWMELERRRGISISSTVLRFEYAGHVFNLLDTPGHADFGDDTYRTLCAADAAVMLLDAAKGLEPQTLKLFRACRARRLPILTFVNKCDRPARPPLALLDELAANSLVPVPFTWPVGDGPDFAGVLERRHNQFVSVERTPHHATPGPEHRLPLSAGAPPGCRHQSWRAAREELDLLEPAGTAFDRSKFLDGRQTPVFFGSARANFGVQVLLEHLIELAPPPAAQRGLDGPRPLESPFSAFVFKVQANLDPRHRDRAAFLRVCSGRFARGMHATSARTGRRLQLRYAHRLFGRERATLDDAVAGDVVAVVDGHHLRLGETLFTEAPVCFPPLPTFAPERFALAHNPDVRRYKQFRRGLAQLAEEGVIQLFTQPQVGTRAPILAAVGELQFEVAQFRMAHEFGCKIELEPAPWRLVRPLSAADASALEGESGVALVAGSDGSLHALFRSEHVLDAIRERHPELGRTIATDLEPVQ